MSFDQFVASGKTHESASTATDATTELNPAEGTPELEETPVSFIRESWLQPSSTTAAGGDTDPLPMIIRGRPMSQRPWTGKIALALAVVACTAIAGLSYLSLHNQQAAERWKQRDLAQVAVTQAMNDQLKKANDHITTLDGTVGSLQGQLATETSKAKANSGASGFLHRVLWPFG
jgi:hypothetical protein